MTEKKVYKPNCCTECCFTDECFSDARVKCADYEIAIKEYYRGLSEGLEEGCLKARELEKENAELKLKNEKLYRTLDHLREAKNRKQKRIEILQEGDVARFEVWHKRLCELEKENKIKEEIIIGEQKENARLSKMLEIVLPKALEHENHIFYEHKRTLEQYRAELEERVKEN